MPQAVPAAVTIGTATSAAAIATQIAVSILSSIALGAISKALSKKTRADAPPINVTIRNTVEHRRQLFGTVRAGGVFVYYATSGDNNKYLWYVIVFAGHQCEAIRDVWMDTNRVSNSDINGGAAGGGAVGGGTFSGKLQIWKFLGGSTQTAETNINTALTQWTNDHKLLGCAGIVARLERDDAIWVNGAPQAVTALVDGALCYDPREVGHDPDDPSTWEFTRNSALHVRHYLSGGSVINDDTTRLIRYGLKVSDARIDDDYTIAAANICDEVLSGAEAPPSGSQPRYCCDLEVSCAETRGEIPEALLMTMAGSLVIAHGKYRIYAGAYDSPTHALDQDDIYDGELQCEDTLDHQRRYNAVAAVFRDASKEYVEQTTPYWTDSSYETQDGGRRIPLEIDLRGVTDRYQAQRLAKIKHVQSRMMRTIKLPCALNGLKVALNETFTYSHTRYGWSNRIFRCGEREIEIGRDAGAGHVVLTGTRDDPAVYADPLTADYLTGTSTTPTLTTDVPDAPSNLTFIPVPDGIQFTVTLPTYVQAETVTELWEYTASTPFASATRIAQGKGNVFVVKKQDTTTRYYWARLRSANNQTSATYPASTGMAAYALPSAQGVVPDGEFALATDQTYWHWGNDANDLQPSISLSGGLVAGYMQLASTGTEEPVTIYSKRTPGYPMLVGQVYSMTVRWRRTASVSGGGNLTFGLVTIDAYPPGTVGGAGDPISLSDTQINALTVNAWQTSQSNFQIIDTAGATQYVAARIVDSLGTGTIQIEAVEVVPATPPVSRSDTRTAGHTFAFSDIGRIQNYDSTSSGNFTVPPDSSVLMPDGATLYARQANTGALSIVAGSGVTIQSPNNSTATRTISGRYGMATLIKIAADTWTLTGDLT